MSSILILNGPNLNLLGVREPHIYGTTTLAQVEQRARTVAGEVGLNMEFRQSNYEGQLIDWIHEARTVHAAIIINPAALTFTSMALMDALKAVALPVIEVHISNIHRRESIYHNSLISGAAHGVVCGLGTHGYEIAIRYLGENLESLTAKA